MNNKVEITYNEDGTKTLLLNGVDLGGVAAVSTRIEPGSYYSIVTIELHGDITIKNNKNLSTVNNEVIHR